MASVFLLVLGLGGFCACYGCVLLLNRLVVWTPHCFRFLSVVDMRAQLYNTVGRRVWVYLPWSWRFYLQRYVNSVVDEVLSMHVLLGKTLVQGSIFALVLSVLLYSVAAPYWWWGLVAVVSCTPLWWVLRLRRAYQEAIRCQRKQLPFFLDLLVLGVESGLGVWVAIQKSAQALPPGILRNNLQACLWQVQSGMPRQQALQLLAQRCGLFELQRLAAAVEHAVTIGMSLGEILRAQAEQCRSERFLRAEKQALETPTKMLLPMVCCVFPCTFLVIAYPIAQQLLADFGIG